MPPKPSAPTTAKLKRVNQPQEKALGSKENAATKKKGKTKKGAKCISASVEPSNEETTLPTGEAPGITASSNLGESSPGDDGPNVICNPPSAPVRAQRPPQPAPVEKLTAAKIFENHLKKVAETATEEGRKAVRASLGKDEAQCIAKAKSATEGSAEGAQETPQFPRGAKACTEVAEKLEAKLSVHLATIDTHSTLDPKVADDFMQALLDAAGEHKVKPQKRKRVFHNRQIRRLADERRKFEGLHENCTRLPENTSLLEEAKIALKVWRAHRKWRAFELDLPEQVIDALHTVAKHLAKKVEQHADKLKTRLMSRRQAYARGAYTRNPRREKARLLDGLTRGTPTESKASCEEHFRSDYQKPQAPSGTLAAAAQRALEAALAEANMDPSEALGILSLADGAGVVTVTETGAGDPSAAPADVPTTVGADSVLIHGSTNVRRVTKEDVRALVGALDDRKGCRGDIPNALLKALVVSEKMATALAYVLSTWLVHGMPQKHKEYVTTLVAKPGREPHHWSSWRKISQPRIWANLFHRVVFKRLEESMEPNLPPEMMGFRRQADGCVHLVAKMRLWMLANEGRERHVLITDMASAFDRMERGRLLEALDYWKVDPILRSAVESIMTSSRTEIVAADGLSAPVSLDGFAVQGSALTPLLFNCYLAETVKYVSAVGKYFDTSATDFAMGIYADDCVVGMRDKTGLKVLLKVFHACLAHLNIGLNSSKSYIESADGPTFSVQLAEGDVVTSRKSSEPVLYLGTPLLVCGKQDELNWDAQQARADQVAVYQVLHRELAAIGATPWSPMQKVDAIKTRLYGKLVYLFRMCWLPPAFLKELDKKLRDEVRGWLNFSNLGGACFQAQQQFGGLQLRSLENLYNSVTAVALPSLLQSPDQFIRGQMMRCLTDYAKSIATRRTRRASVSQDPAPREPEGEPDENDDHEADAVAQLLDLCAHGTEDGPQPSGNAGPRNPVSRAARTRSLAADVSPPLLMAQLPMPKAHRPVRVLGLDLDSLQGIRYNAKRPFEAKMLAAMRQYAENGVEVVISTEGEVAINMEKAGKLNQHLKQAYFDRANFDFGCMAQGQSAAICGSTTANRSLLSHRNGLRDYEVLNGLRARTFALWCGSVRSRLAGSSSKADCPFCSQRESQAHLLGGCPATRSMVISRHNRVVTQLGDDLRSVFKDNKQNTLVEESSISINSQSLLFSELTKEFLLEVDDRARAEAGLRDELPLQEQLAALKHFAPDIIIRHTQDGMVSFLLLDVTICNAREELISERRQEKETRYQPMADWLRVKCNAYSSEVIPIVLTSNGLATESAATGLAKVLSACSAAGPQANRKTASWMLRRSLEKVLIPYVNKLAYRSATAHSG